MCVCFLKFLFERFLREVLGKFLLVLPFPGVLLLFLLMFLKDVLGFPLRFSGVFYVFSLVFFKGF